MLCAIASLKYSQGFAIFMRSPVISLWLKTCARLHLKDRKGMGSLGGGGGGGGVEATAVLIFCLEFM